MGSPEVVGNRGQEEEEEVGNATGLPNRLFYSASSIPDRLTFKFAGGGGEGRKRRRGYLRRPCFRPFSPTFTFVFFPLPLSRMEDARNGNKWKERKRRGGGAFCNGPPPSLQRGRPCLLLLSPLSFSRSGPQIPPSLVSTYDSGSHSLPTHFSSPEERGKS